jgi:hypothetical protein
LVQAQRFKHIRSFVLGGGRLSPGNKAISIVPATSKNLTPRLTGQARARPSRFHFRTGAEPLSARLSEETRIEPSFDSNLLADSAADELQHTRVSRATFGFVLKRVLLRRTKF